MVHRSIEIKSMRLKSSKDFTKVKSRIVKDFGDGVFVIEYNDGYVIVQGDLHDYKVRDKLYKIITGRSVRG